MSTAENSVHHHENSSVGWFEFFVRGAGGASVQTLIVLMGSRAHSTPGLCQMYVLYLIL